MTLDVARSAVTPPGPPLLSAHGDDPMHSALTERHDTAGRVHDTREKDRPHTRLISDLGSRGCGGTRQTREAEEVGKHVNRRNSGSTWSGGTWQAREAEELGKHVGLDRPGTWGPLQASEWRGRSIMTVKPRETATIQCHTHGPTRDGHSNAIYNI